jgi:hypothetical protein
MRQTTAITSVVASRRRSCFEQRVHYYCAARTLRNGAQRPAGPHRALDRAQGSLPGMCLQRLKPWYTHNHAIRDNLLLLSHKDAHQEHAA